MIPRGHRNSNLAVAGKFDDWMQIVPVKLRNVTVFVDVPDPRLAQPKKIAEELDSSSESGAHLWREVRDLAAGE